MSGVLDGPTKQLLDRVRKGDAALSQIDLSNLDNFGPHELVVLAVALTASTTLKTLKLTTASPKVSFVIAGCAGSTQLTRHACCAASI